MSWEKELEELKKRAELAKEMGGIERVAKHYSRGRLTVRERIDKLLDKDADSDHSARDMGVEYATAQVRELWDSGVPACGRIAPSQV